MIVSQKLCSLWGKQDVSLKERLQKLVFPEGLEYNRKEGAFRTPKVNLIFETIDYFSSGKGGNKKGLPPFLREQSRSAGWRLQLDDNEPIRFDAFPSSPEISFQVTKIQLPDDFIPELDKIENFYDLHLQELLPISVGEQDNSQQAKENPCYANRGKLVG